MPGKTIRVALIGHGLSGAYFHGPLLEADPRFRIALVATSRPSTVGLRRDAPTCTADPRAACMSKDVDLVVIASPNDSHCALARLALESGKHVVVDKPFVLSIAEANELIALARSRKLLLSVFQNRRLDGDFAAVKNVLMRNEVGEVLLFESRWDRFKLGSSSGWRYAAGRGSGLLWDLGPHLIDQAVLLFGMPERWHMDMAAQRTGTDVDDYFELTLCYGRMRCILAASTSVAASRPRFAAHGTRGSFLTFGVDPFEAALRDGRKPADPGFRSALPPIPALFVEPDGRRMDRAIEAGAWEKFYFDIAQAVLQGEPNPHAAEHVRAVIGIIEAARAQRSSTLAHGGTG